MTLNPNKNNTNWNTMQNDKYACMVVFRTLSFLCIASLIVILGYLYININSQNRKLDMENNKKMAEYTTLSVQLQNIESELEQKGNIQLVSKAPELNLRKATTAQIYLLDAPSPLEVVQESEVTKAPMQVAGK
jgi:hypothetical protein